MDDEARKHEEDAYTYHFFFNHGLYDELLHYKDLIAETKGFLTEKKISTEENDSDERFGKEMQFNSIFPSILWKSLFLSSYYLLENSLDEISKNLKKSNSYKLSLSEMSGNGIFRSSLYLKKVCDITNSFKTNTWTEITDFNKIRNVLVHANGVFLKSKTDLIDVCSKYVQIQLIEFDEDNLCIEFGNDFCEYALSKIEELFKDIHTEMQK